MSKRRALGTLAKLPRSAWPAKVSPEAQPKIIQTVTEDPEAAPRELQAPLGSAFGMPQSERTKTFVYHVPRSTRIVPSVLGRCSVERQSEPRMNQFQELDDSVAALYQMNVHP
ncbi:hypothetical protein QQF64_012821 [Cirrhinus molitorella]|uniref:Uncharacterized protein n=1 Tax=Cirrhinus molitorella TaxID=172907 RepID=A0ABR3LZ29_9TELE